MMNPVVAAGRFLGARLRAYAELVKYKQTLLLTITGWAGYSSAACPLLHLRGDLVILGSLFLSIGGCTVINMILDRDIDAVMKRTRFRPLPSGMLSLREVIALAAALSGAGLIWSFSLSWLYGLVVLAGFVFNILVYTVLLKRYTPLSIIFGGIAGGMPILAGRVLGSGQIDLVGVLLAVSIVLWIPTHTITFSVRYEQDYADAGIPTFPSKYGHGLSRLVTALTTVLASVSMTWVISTLPLKPVCLIGTVSMGVLLATWAAVSVVRPSPQVNYGLFKAGSVYMLASMVLILVGM